MSGFEIFGSRLLIEGELEAVTPLRIGAGRSGDAAESDLPVLKDVLGRPLIPGSSLKGALRSHIEAVLRGVEATQPVNGNYRLTCDVLDDCCLTEDDVKQIKNDARKVSLAVGQPPSQIVDDEILTRTCLTCRLFGSPNAAAKLALRDLPVISDYWGDRYMLRDGVAIDRDTGTAVDGKKYDFEAVPAGTRFEFCAQVDNAEDVELGLALLILHALETAQVQLGGSKSRGLGWCKLVNPRYTLHNSPINFLLGREGSKLDEGARESYVNAFLRGAGLAHA